MNKVQGVTTSAPFELKALLATMKSAKAQGVNMNVWDRDIKAVEEAIATIEAVRLLGERRLPRELIDREPDHGQYLPPH